MNKSIEGASMLISRELSRTGPKRLSKLTLYQSTRINRINRKSFISEKIQLAYFYWGKEMFYRIDQSWTNFEHSHWSNPRSTVTYVRDQIIDMAQFYEAVLNSIQSNLSQIFWNNRICLWNRVILITWYWMDSMTPLLFRRLTNSWANIEFYNNFMLTVTTCQAVNVKSCKTCLFLHDFASVNDDWHQYAVFDEENDHVDQFVIAAVPVDDSTEHVDKERNKQLHEDGQQERAEESVDLTDKIGDQEVFSLPFHDLIDKCAMDWRAIVD